MTALLRVAGLTKTYEGAHGVTDVSFDARAGEIVGVLGPNGAGKTTLLRVLTTLLSPTSGSFEVAGIPHTDAQGIRRRIGVLPESSGAYGNLTGHETLVYFARLHGSSKTEAATRADCLLDEVGLAPRGRSLVKTYSRGMRQRLGIARALVNEPRVLFLDEPTLGLDPAGQLDLLATIRSIAKERGATILLCTHQLEDVEELATRVLILRSGRVAAQGTLDEVRGRSGATRGARIQVPAARSAEAARLLASLGAKEDPAKPGTIRVELPAESPAALVDALGALSRAGIQFLRVEREGSRLSDAFYALTRAGGAA